MRIQAVREDGKADGAILRPFQKTDLDAAFALDQVCFPQGIAYSRAELRYFVSRPSAYAVVAEKAGLLAGFLVAGHNARQTSGMAHIVTLDIDPGRRRAGIASSLMEDAELHYRQLRCGGLRLEVAVDNEAAQHFYRSQGFVPTGRLRGYYNGLLDALSMRKDFL